MIWSLALSVFLLATMVISPLRIPNLEDVNSKSNLTVGPDRKQSNFVATIQRGNQDIDSVATVIILPFPPDDPNADILESYILESSIVIIGKVGRQVGADTPSSGHVRTSSGITLTPPPPTPVVFLDIEVVDSLGSDVPSKLTLMRVNPTSPTQRDLLDFDLSPLTFGQEVLLFLTAEDRRYYVRKYGEYYTASYFDYGIFDIIGDRAYPRNPYPFRTSMADFYHFADNYQGEYKGTDQQPFFELEPLKEYISAVSSGGGIGPFRDTLYSEHRDSIRELSDIGVVRGCNPPLNTEYCPDRSLLRGEMATLLARVLNLPETGRDMFVDDDGNPHEQNINRLAVDGISQGCRTGMAQGAMFCPDRPVTRGEMASFLVRAFGLGEMRSGQQEPVPAEARNPRFGDIQGNIHADNINLIATAGITRGCGDGTSSGQGSMGNFCPNRHISRAETATLLHRAIYLNR